MSVKKVTEPVLLGEGPHWDGDQQALFFVSIQDHTIHRYLPSTGLHTKTTLAGPVGFIVPVEGTKDQFVVGVSCRFVVVSWDGCDGSAATELRTLAEVDQHCPGNRINDGKADPRGRLFAANMRYIFDFKKNGLEGVPDGTTIDTDGNLWVAVFNGSCIIQIDPRSGNLLRKVPIPALQVTSVTFGGQNLDVLFVTTASLNISGEQKHPCGSTFLVTGLGVKGYPNVNFKL